MSNETAPISWSHEVNPRVRGLFLKNLGGVQTEEARVVAGFIPALVIWRQRKEFPALVFRLLRRVQDLRVSLNNQNLWICAAVHGSVGWLAKDMLQDEL